MHEQVKEFHLKNGYPVDRDLAEDAAIANPERDNLLMENAKKLLAMAKQLKDPAIEAQEKHSDPRLYRLYLMLEELGESAEALAIGDEEKLADGLGDLEYVTVGTNVTYDIPTRPVFDEIHRANMNKKKRTEDDPRMRNKGADWQRPDIRKAIDEGRLLCS